MRTGGESRRAFMLVPAISMYIFSVTVVTTTLALMVATPEQSERQPLMGTISFGGGLDNNTADLGERR